MNNVNYSGEIKFLVTQLFETSWNISNNVGVMKEISAKAIPQKFIDTELLNQNMLAESITMAKQNLQLLTRLDELLCSQDKDMKPSC